MLRFIISLFFLHIFFISPGQRVVSPAEAVEMSFNNQRNLKAFSLTVQQQEQLLSGTAGLENPQVFAEASPYEPLVIGFQQTINLPSVYRNRKSLQQQRLNLARLQLQGSQYELKREVMLNYLQVQYLLEKEKIFRFQDSVYAEIKISSKRFFDAGQINKLEELQSATQADQVKNELMRVRADLESEKQIFSFYTAITDSFLAEPIKMYSYVPPSDSAENNIQQQILRQQIKIGDAELQVEKSALLPQLQAGLLFPTAKEYERFVGYQVGVSIPIWRKQNRSRIAAVETGINVSRAQQELALQRFIAQSKQAYNNYEKELQSLNYFNMTALPQARAIIETSQRLFHGGELNYIESLRNLQLAFDIFINHLETHRAYNEAVILLNYLNGTL